VPLIRGAEKCILPLHQITVMSEKPKRTGAAGKKPSIHSKRKTKPDGTKEPRMRKRAGSDFETRGSRAPRREGDSSERPRFSRDSGTGRGGDERAPRRRPDGDSPRFERPTRSSAPRERREDGPRSREEGSTRPPFRVGRGDDSSPRRRPDGDKPRFERSDRPSRSSAPRERREDGPRSREEGSSRPPFRVGRSDDNSPRRRPDGDKPRFDRPARREDGPRSREEGSSRPFRVGRSDDSSPRRRPDGDKPRFERPARREDGPRSREEGSTRPPFRVGRSDDRSPSRRPDGDKPRFDRPARREDGPRSREEGSSRPFRVGRSDDSSPRRRPDGDKPRFERSDRPARSSERSSEDRPRSRDDREPRKPFSRDNDSSKPEGSFGTRSSRGGQTTGGEQSSRGKSRDMDFKKGSTRRNSIKTDAAQFKVSRAKGKERELVWGDDKDSGKRSAPQKYYLDEKVIRLNRYLANAGVCSRREADTLIEAGTVTVNGVVVTEFGTKVGPDDVVIYGGQRLSREKLVYVLLNKPKEYVITLRDPKGYKTVYALTKGACREHIVPVGKLERETSGLLLMTNDADMSKKLAYHKNKVMKLYHVHTDKKITVEDMQKLMTGISYEDGIAKVENAAYVGDTQREMGVEIHSNKSGLVTKMFETLGYKVVKLDRVIFAGLTKKDLPRGRWRFLTEMEVNKLKMVK
jgi:23S rRNA pseudouridine2605 synthase